MDPQALFPRWGETGLEGRRIKRKNVSGMALILTDAKSDGEII